MTRVLVVALAVFTVGCKREPPPVKDIAVAEAAAQFAAGSATPVDANTDDYRDAVGWVPGAVRLTDSNAYPLTELPQDKSRPLVFYCTSRM
jgi:rhodanese-related sulfurtransferase